MRERTRQELSELILAYVEEGTDENFQAVFDRAPVGNYYVYTDDGNRYIVDRTEDALGLELDTEYEPEEVEEEEAA